VRVKGVVMSTQDREKGRLKYASTSSVFAARATNLGHPSTMTHVRLYGRVQHWLAITIRHSRAIVPLARVHVYDRGEGWHPRAGYDIVNINNFEQRIIRAQHIDYLALMAYVDEDRRQMIPIV
jgi:hypothetical protein